MDIDQIRRNNIALLEAENGGATAFSAKVGMTLTQYQNLRDGAKDSKTGKPRGMRKETAWRFENAGNKPPGWLDQDHSAESINAPDQAFISSIKIGLTERELPDHIRQTILTLIASSPKKPT